MRTCYIAAPFLYDAAGTLHHDIRSLALGGEQFLLRPQKPEACIRFCGETFRYIGPFWYEETADGVFTDCDSASLVRREKALIDEADFLIVIFDGSFAPGTAAELVYAATTGKEIAVVYVRGEAAESDVPSTCWYPIVLAQTVCARVRVLSVESVGALPGLFGKEIDADFDALLRASNAHKCIG